MRWRGVRSGKTLTIMGGVHGNELLGIKVVEWLKRKMAANKCDFAGQLICGVGNPAAAETGTRATHPEFDLNRCFNVTRRANVSHSYEERRAEELAPLLSATDILIDLHSTNKPSSPFLRLAGHVCEEHMRLASHLSLGAATILLDPDYTIGGGKVATTDEFVGFSGGIGICYETGHADDLSALPNVKREIASLLASELCLDMHRDLDDDAPPCNSDAADKQQEFFKLTEAIMYEDGFEWALGRGCRNFERVPAHRFIATMTSPSSFSRRIVRDFDAYLIFPKPAHLCIVGKPVVWLAKKSG